MAPRPKTLTPELLADDLLGEVCTAFKSLEKVRLLLIEATVEPPDKSRKRVREAKHALASAMQIVLYAIEETRQLQALLSPAAEANGSGAKGSAGSRSPK